MERSRLVTGLLACFLISSPPIISAQDREPHYDLVIQHAVVFDGISLKGVKTDVAIEKDRIVYVGKIVSPHADQVIEGKGLVLAPGFIDLQTHADFSPQTAQEDHSKIQQGITTVVTGNCGISAAPAAGLYDKHSQALWKREGLDLPPHAGWNSFEQYRDVIRSLPLETNYAALVGHNNLRSALMGLDPRPASASEVQSMKQTLSKALQEGAFGISFNLSEAPGKFADPQELIELCEESGRHLGVCAFHLRDERARWSQAVSEVVAIGEKTKTRVMISHVRVQGKENWPQMDEALEKIEQARLQGVKLTANVVPYPFVLGDLARMLPDELFDRKDRIAYFQNILNRMKLIEKLRWYDDQGYFHWDSIVLASAEQPKYQVYEGKTLKQIARELKLEPCRLLIALLSDSDFKARAFYFSETEQQVSKWLDQSYVAVVTDSQKEGVRKPHPANAGAFPRVLETWVREKKQLALGEAIRKMTSLPAETMGIKDRGRIEAGAYADLVLFDAGDISDESTYADSAKAPAGIQWVFVNGKAVMAKGKLTHEKPGSFLTNPWQP